MFAPFRAVCCKESLSCLIRLSFARQPSVVAYDLAPGQHLACTCLCGHALNRRASPAPFCNTFYLQLPNGKTVRRTRVFATNVHTADHVDMTETCSTLAALQSPTCAKPNTVCHLFCSGATSPPTTACRAPRPRPPSASCGTSAPTARCVGRSRPVDQQYPFHMPLRFLSAH